MRVQLKPLGSDRIVGRASPLFGVRAANDLTANNPERTTALSTLLDQWEAEMSKTAEPFVVPKEGKQ
jgi:hypothetical protein